MENNFITDYSDCTDFRDYIKNNLTTDYADYIDFKDYIKKIISPLTTLTTLTMLVLETT